MTTSKLNKARVADLYTSMIGYVKRGDIPGIVTLIGRGDEIHLNMVGMKTIDGKEPMRRDTIFRIASITKPITAAAASEVVVVEGNIYFPITAARREHLQASDHQTVCPWKGTAHYYDVIVDGNVNKNAAWYYPEPKDAAKQIAGRVAFWKGVEVIA